MLFLAATLAAPVPRDEASGHSGRRLDWDAFFTALEVNVNTNVPVTVGVGDEAAAAAISAAKGQQGGSVAEFAPQGAEQQQQGAYNYYSSYGGGQYYGGQNVYAVNSGWVWQDQALLPPSPPPPPPPPSPPPSPPPPPVGFRDDRDDDAPRRDAAWDAAWTGERSPVAPHPVWGSASRESGCGYETVDCGPTCCGAGDRCRDARLGQCADRYGRPKAPVGFTGDAAEDATSGLLGWVDNFKPPVTVSVGPKFRLTGSSRTCDCYTCAGDPCSPSSGSSTHRCSTCGPSTAHCSGSRDSKQIGCWFSGEPNLEGGNCQCH